MSGRRIDDHKFWAGGPGKNSVLPDGPYKTKAEMSADGSGHLGSEYPDTTEMIHRDQKMGDSKAKSHGIKSGYRN
jgi:hypothetical protein